MRAHDLTQEGAAKRLKTTQGTVSQLLAGTIKRPGLELAVAIETEAAIPHTDWLDEPEPSPRARRRAARERRAA